MEEEKKYCGECAMMQGEDIDGRGYCALKDLYTYVHCGDESCNKFIQEKISKKLDYDI